ncbi:BTAD domain-containing putative transcriptional regulator [Isachenkonia alkalipeptolytica]|uniref:Bacterial transcriptional activator domain-containing protein n=1 Tax=Isachenkonia alkalipeptolytica TaxID=2565777 RepID=A0AA44BCV9_9CLOT|nr:BTAD domain-containing putative transcriptional regulator [Isachenkonia alkalipeptolytica]NBG87313.1 hypothetical protein [Isachenkonia alkalipeptolytica]
MDIIKVNLFGTPGVYKNGEKLHFPYRKAEALFYYLLVQHQGTREELVSLFWAESNEEVAKKNLRNAMYKTRKAFGLEIIHSPKKSTVMINKEVPIESDIQSVQQNPGKILELYRGEFLKGFYIKNEEGFSNWVDQQRSFYRNLYIEKSHEKIDEALKKGNFIQGEKECKKVIQEDEFDERGYRKLMEVYQSLGLSSKALEVYQNLHRCLEEELGIEPDEKTRKVHLEILQQGDKNSPAESREEKSIFFGRQEELKKGQAFLEASGENQGKSALVILGEAGIGKTSLKEKLLKDARLDNQRILSANCYAAEEDYVLKPWNAIMAKLLPVLKKEEIRLPKAWSEIAARAFPHFLMNEESPEDPFNGKGKVQDQLLEEALVEIFQRVLRKKDVLLVFEDLQWMDEKSLRLLENLLMKIDSKGLRMLGTLRNGENRDLKFFLSQLSRENRLGKIFLERFTKEETLDFMENFEKYFPRKSEKNLQKRRRTQRERLKKEIYRETEGNPFFIVEYLYTLKNNNNRGTFTPKIEDLLKTRFRNLSKKEEEVSDMAAIFFDKVDFEGLKDLTGWDELALINHLEALSKEGILEEDEEEDRIQYRFTHQKLREFCYLRQSKGKRKILHTRIGKNLEKKLDHGNRDRLLYSKLIYHFSRAGNHGKTLKYSIKNLNQYVDFSHELFPVLEQHTGEDLSQFYLSKRQMSKAMKDIEYYLVKAKETGAGHGAFAKEEMYFHYIKGRYLIWEGSYEVGLEHIDNMIQVALEHQDHSNAVKGYKQRIYYGIQIHDSETVRGNLKKGMELLKTIDYPKEEAVFYRLQGVYYLMTGAYQQADETLRYSIRLFSQLPKSREKYLLNIAAGYNYLGEVRRSQMKFFEGLKYYDEAIRICEDQNISRSLNMFYTKAGQAAFDGGDFHRAKEYLKEGLRLYVKYDVTWGRSTAEGFMALIYFREGEYHKAQECLSRGDKYCKKIQSPYELGILYRIKSGIKREMMERKHVPKSLQDCLPQSLSWYCRQGIDNLEKIQRCYEIDILKRLDGLATEDG